MDAAVYRRMAVQEADHWWFRGRRAVIARLIGGMGLPGGARILETGCGTGGNLAMLARFGRVDAVEYDLAAREMAAAKSGAKIGFCELPDRIDAPDGAYDLVTLLDVLEHVEADVASLRALAAKLAPGGRILVTVPSGPWLWSAHDVAHHHKRRYTRASLRAAIGEAGLECRLIGHFNALLYPVAVAMRLAKRGLRRGGSDDAMPGRRLNRALGAVFGFERRLVGRLPMPFGLSIFAVVARR